MQLAGTQEMLYLVIGSRIHGVMLAIQAGIPGICIAHDTRIEELCDIMHIPYIHSNELKQGFTLDEIKQRIKFDAESFNKNRVELSKKYYRFFDQNKIQLTRKLIN